MWPNPQENADLVTFTEEILNGNFIFCAVYIVYIFGTAWNILAELWISDQSFNRNNLTPHMLKIWNNYAFANCDYSLLHTIYKFPDMIWS